MEVCLLWLLCVVRQRSLRRADHSSRGVLPTLMRRCLWSRNTVNEKALAHWGTVAPKTNKKDYMTCKHFFWPTPFYGLCIITNAVNCDICHYVNMLHASLLATHPINEKVINQPIFRKLNPFTYIWFKYKR